MSAPSLFDRFSEHLAALVASEPANGGPWVVAVSGGVDSVVLLHLLERWGGAELLVAHVDHRMRLDSDRDAEWVGALCAERRIPCVVDTLAAPPASEAEARTLRYEALDARRIEVDAPFVVTGHHADDQAETVLFRATRGTGLDGLAAIPHRSDGRLRPLLPFFREEIEAYAEEHGLTWLEDATNASAGFARNVLRHDVIPRIESMVSPGARAALARLADNARDDRVAWEEVLQRLDTSLGVVDDVGRVVADREAFRALGPELQRRVLRHWLGRCGGQALDRVAIERTRTFFSEGASGRSIELGRRMMAGVELNRIELYEDGRAVEATPPDTAVEIESPLRGVGEARIGGASIPVAWAAHTFAVPREHVGEGVEARFAISDLSFPLTVRGRRPGDRISLAGGTRKVKKVLMEARIGSRARDEIPLLVDAEGSVLWVAGVARSHGARSQGRMLTVRIGR